jgi:RNA polymerase sigma factor (sigma-70 family)
MGTMTDVEPEGVADGDSTGDRDAPAGPEEASTLAEPSRWERAAGCFIRWQEGDTRAMDDLVRLMTPVLWHIVRSYGLDRALAEDVVQTTWLTLVRGHAAIADPRAVSGWLTTCARREAWRVGRLQRRADPTEIEQLEPRLAAAPSAEHEASTADESHRLWRAVAQLNERCQRLLRVVAFDERPDYARIAHDLAMPVGSIGPTRQRCLAKLRVALEDAGWGGGPHA